MVKEIKNKPCQKENLLKYEKLEKVTELLMMNNRPFFSASFDIKDGLKVKLIEEYGILNLTELKRKIKSTAINQMPSLRDINLKLW